MSYYLGDYYNGPRRTGRAQGDYYLGDTPRRRTKRRKRKGGARRVGNAGLRRGAGRRRGGEHPFARKMRLAREKRARG